MKPYATPIRSALPVLLPLAVLFIALFGRVIFQPRTFAFRDSVHFYYPLYEQITTALHRGHFPVWDPAENLGQPLAANPAGALFYPGKLIFLGLFLPGVSYGVCYKWYILGHFILAYLTFYRFARHLGSRGASIFGSLAYTFGGALFFQQTNPIFLVGASWFPAAFSGGMALIDCNERAGLRRTRVLRVAFPLAMMILGGDPQAAYIASLSLVGYFFYRCFFYHRSFHARVPRTRPGIRSGILLITAFFIAALLAMVQILPSLEMTRLTNRAGGTEPVCLWDRIHPVSRAQNDSLPPCSLADGLLCRQIDRPASRVGRIYRFSLPPWELLTMLLPRGGGDLFPENSRAGSALNCGEGDWYGSLYLGFFPLLAVIYALRKHGKNAIAASTRDNRPLRLYMGGVALVFILGSLGAFGPCWLVRVLFGAGSAVPCDGDPVGGVYWLMTQLLPGFASFRYPAKLMTSAALPLCALAVFGYDALLARREIFAVGRMGRVSFAATVSLLLMVALFFLPPWGERFLAALLPQRSLASLFGPMNIAAAARCLGGSALGGALLLVTGGSLFLNRREIGRMWLERSILALLVLDLFAASRWQVVTLPESALNRPIALAGRAASPGSAPVRILRSGQLYPPGFLSTASKNRPAELALWQRATLLSRFAAREGFADLFPTGTMTPTGYDQLKRALFPDPKDASYPGPPADVRDSVLAFLDCRYLLTRVHHPGNFAAERLLPDNRELPWPDGLEFRQMKAFDGRLRLFHREFPNLSPCQELAQRHRCPTSEGESACFIDYQPEKLIIRARLNSPGYLTVAEQYWPGWRCSITPIIGDQPDGSQTYPAEIRSCCGFLRRVDLPSGLWEIEMTYRPTLLYIGGAVSILTLAAVLIIALISRSINSFTKKAS